MGEGGGAGAGRSTAVVLFTDLVGSTELRSRLGDEAAEAVRHQHDRLVNSAIEANRGRLVKNLGDGVMATFAGASDALAAAVTIQQAIDRHNRSGGRAAPLDVRIGISAGDVAFEEGDCFGTPVIEAARLCTAARGGQVLVSEVVRWLEGSAGGHEFTSVGALDLKGLPAAVPACQVTWDPLPTAPLPLPSLLTGAGQIFVGRDEHLERLNRLWSEVAERGLRMAVLAGEPGIGKTRLAVQLAAAVHAEGAVVLAGRCDEDLGVPYQPFVEALRHYTSHDPQPRLGRYGGELARLVPEVAQAVPDLPELMQSDPETERYRLFDAVAAWLAAASVEAPVLLVLDDLQWAAKPTLLLLRHVLRSAEPLRLLMVATYRDTDVSPRDPLSELLADLWRERGVERLALAGLDRAAVGAYIEAAAGHALPEEDASFTQAVWAETEGNPFFVAEVLRHLSESGAVERRNGRWVTTAPVEELGIPESVRSVIGRRLARLSPGTNRTLKVASVVGLEFEPAIVQASGAGDEEEVLSALDEARAARLLVEVPGPRYRFSHALVRATLYDELSAARRVALHRRVGEVIEELYAAHLDDQLPALTYHFARSFAPSSEMRKAVGYATRAGDRALAQLANDEAAGYYRQALELLTLAAGSVDEGQRLELLLSLGEAERRGGNPAYRQTLLDAASLAQTRGDRHALARAALANSRGGIVNSPGRVDDELVTMLEAALEQTDESDTATRARLLANLGVELIFAPDRDPVALSHQALALARHDGNESTLAHVLRTRYYTITRPETRAERWANTAELLAVAEKLADPAIRCQAHYFRARSGMEVGDIEEFDRSLEVAERLAFELGQPTLQWVNTWQRIGRVVLAGRFEEAERLSLEALELGEGSGQADARIYFFIQSFTIRFEQGRLAEMEGSLTDMAARIPGLPVLDTLLGLLYSELDRDDEARVVLKRFAGSAFDRLPRDVTRIRAITPLAVVAARLGATAEAQALYDLLAPHHDQLDTMAGIVAGAVAHYLGPLATVLGRLEEAEAHFNAAEQTHVRIGAPAWLARTRLEWARMLLARRASGDVERARDLLDQALNTARELGLANVERRAVGLLT